jgi:hypothetical protein
MDDTNVKSINQSGGITANTVSVDNLHNNFLLNENLKPKKSKLGWIIAGIGLLASIVTILTYLNIYPFNFTKMNNDNNKINVTSNNQSGGITAHTVNVGPQPRQMNQEVAASLKQNIPASAKVTITSVMGDGEAFAFATQVMQWMKKNGYANVDGVNQAIYSAPVMGQGINKKPGSENAYDIVIGTKQ